MLHNFYNKYLYKVFMAGVKTCEAKVFLVITISFFFCHCLPDSSENLKNRPKINKI